VWRLSRYCPLQEPLIFFTEFTRSVCWPAFALIEPEP